MDCVRIKIANQQVITCYFKSHFGSKHGYKTFIEKCLIVESTTRSIIIRDGGEWFVFERNGEHYVKDAYLLYIKYQ